MKRIVNVLKHIQSMPDGVITDSELRRYLGNDYNERLQQLIEDGFIVEASYAISGSEEAVRMEAVAYKLSVKGEDRVTAHALRQDKKRKQRAKEKAQAAAKKRKSKANRVKEFRNQLLIAVISSLITLVIEHFDEFIDFIKKILFGVCE